MVICRSINVFVYRVSIVVGIVFKLFLTVAGKAVFIFTCPGVGYVFKILVFTCRQKGLAIILDREIRCNIIGKPQAKAGV